MIKRLSDQEKEIIIQLYREGNNCVQIKNRLGLRGHQQVFNVITKLPDYIPYRNGRRTERKYSLREDYFETIDTEQKSYILGFLCADGHVDTVRGALKFLCQTSDKDVLEKISVELGSNQVIKNFVKPSHFSYGKREFQHSKIEFCSRRLINSLVSKGLDKVKTYSLGSFILKCVPEGLIRHFLRGYFDGDGNVTYGVTYSSGTKYNINIAGNLEFLENTFGKYFPTVNSYYKDKRSRQCYVYRISSKSRVEEFLEYIYGNSSIYLDRKYRIYERMKVSM